MGMDSAAIMTFVSFAIVSEISKVWKSQKKFLNECWNVEVVVWEILKLMYSLFSKLAHFAEAKINGGKNKTVKLARKCEQI